MKIATKIQAKTALNRLAIFLKWLSIAAVILLCFTVFLWVLPLEWFVSTSPLAAVLAVAAGLALFIFSSWCAWGWTRGKAPALPNNCQTSDNKD